MTRRTLALVVAVAAAGVIHTPAARAAGCNYPTKHARAACLVNRERVQRGLVRLGTGSVIHRSSRVEAEKVRRCGFSHYPCGVPWTRSLRPFTRGCSWWTAGEALGRRYATAAGVVRAWMASPAHRAVLLNGRVRRIGVAHHLGVWVLHVAVCR